MSKAKQCDICGDYFSYIGDENFPKRMKHKFKGMNVLNGTPCNMRIGTNTYDICRPCYHAIMAVINGRWKDEI